MSLLLRSQGMAVAAVALGVSVFLSRILGLVRDKVISYYFGAGVEADVYFTAFVVPDFLNYLLAGGYFSITLVPLLASAFLRDEEDGWRFFSTAVCWAALCITVLTAVAWIYAPVIAALIAPGFTEEAVARLGGFLRIILPAQIFFLPGACFSAVLYYRRQFTVPALTPLIYNGCIIAGGVLSVVFFPARGMEGFCWGVLAGALFGSLLLPLVAVRAGGMRFFPALSHPRMKTLVLLALPLMLGQSIVTLDEQFVRIFGSLAGEGSVSLLSYARRIMLVPVGVVAQAAGLASFPFLAALAAAKDNRGFDAQLQGATTNTILLALPLSLWMAACAEPIMRLIFQQGSFTPEAATQSGLLLSVMLCGVGFWVIQQIVGRAFYAQQNTLTPALTGTLATCLTVPVYWFGARHLGALGVALAGLVGVALYTVLLVYAWQRRFGRGGLIGVAGNAALAFLFCLPAAGAAYAATLLCTRIWGGISLWGAFTGIALSGIAFAVVYLGATLIFRPALCEPLRVFTGKIRKRFI